jgi:hypothetical protein
MVGITRDITAEHESALERERLLKREREARDEAERQSSFKDEFWPRSAMNCERR